MCTPFAGLKEINDCCAVVLPIKNIDVDVRAGPLARQRVILLVYEEDIMSSQHQQTEISIK